MSIPVFAHDANPAVDRHLFTTDRETVILKIRMGEVTVLRNRKGKEWAVQFKPVGAENTLQSQLKAFLESHPEVGEAGETAEALLDMFKSAEEESNAAISAKEAKANVGEPDGPGGELSPVQILRARTKLLAWPFAGDDRAIRVGVGCRA